jgi:hypothetical protein
VQIIRLELEYLMKNFTQKLLVQITTKLINYPACESCHSCETAAAVTALLLVLNFRANSGGFLQSNLYLERVLVQKAHDRTCSEFLFSTFSKSVNSNLITYFSIDELIQLGLRLEIVRYDVSASYHRRPKTIRGFATSSIMRLKSPPH